MTHLNFIKPVYLNNIFDEIMRNISSDSEFFDDFKSVYKPKLQFEDYPHNIYVTDDGVTVLEIAAGGLDKDEINVNVEDNIISIISNRKVDGNVNKEIHYLHNKLVKKDIKLSYKLSDKTDVDNINVSLSKGILKVDIPIKPECKPVKKSFKIQ
jgi:HSP20 family protein